MLRKRCGWLFLCGCWSMWQATAWMCRHPHRRVMMRRPALPNNERIILENETQSTTQTRTNAMDIPYDITLQALQTYHALHGDLVIPRRYTVTSTAFPSDWYGLDLSSTVYNMKWWQLHIQERPDRVAELNRLGFVWERLQPEWNLVLEALITYYNLHGHVLVPNQFVVPLDNAQWPRATWGIPLGKSVYRIRARHDFLRGPTAEARRQQLEGLGFVWDVHEERFLKFYDIMWHYARLEQCGPFSPGERTQVLKVPAQYVVPSEDPQWPEAFWGYPLGVKCHAVRQKGLYVKKHPERRRLLEELGFRWTGNSNLGWLEVVHAAAIYSKLHNRSLDVPIHFVVPKPHEWIGEEWPWPEHLWGLPLGQRLKDIRLKGAYLKGPKKEERIRQLETLGFQWEPKRRGRPKKISQECQV